MNLIPYLSAPYVEGGRSLQALDCWGLVLLIREHMGLPELPSLGGVDRTTPLGMNASYKKVSGGLIAGEPQIGSIAAVFRGSLLVHVGVVLEIEGRLAVLETNPGSGVRWMRVPQFNERYYRVVYYHDPNLA